MGDCEAVVGLDGHKEALHDGQVRQLSHFLYQPLLFGRCQKCPKCLLVSLVVLFQADKAGQAELPKLRQNYHGTWGLHARYFDIVDSCNV